MKKLIVLFTGVIIAAGAAAQTDKTGSNAQQAAQADRQAPVSSERAKRPNTAAEPQESANSVDPDFQGSSGQHTTSSGMGQPKKDTTRPTKADKTGADVQDIEDKTKKQ